LIDGEGDDVGNLGIDPDGVIVVASGSAFDGGGVLTGNGRAVGRRIGHINHVFIFWINADAAEVVAASPDAVFVVHLLPAFARVVGAVDAAAFLGIHPRIHAIGIAGRNGGTDAANALGFAGQSFGELPPGVSSIGGFVEAAALAGVAASGRPRRTARGPHAGEDDLRVAGIEDEIHAA